MRPDCNFILNNQPLTYHQFRERLLNDPSMQELVSEIADTGEMPANWSPAAATKKPRKKPATAKKTSVEQNTGSPVKTTATNEQAAQKLQERSQPEYAPIAFLYRGGTVDRGSARAQQSNPGVISAYERRASNDNGRDESPRKTNQSQLDSFRLLEQYADENNFRLAGPFFRRLVNPRTEVAEAGAEHSVYGDSKSNRIIKVTHPDFVGDGTLGAKGGAKEYFEALHLSNLVFGTDTRFEGLIESEDGVLPQVVTSQQYVQGARPASTAEIAAELKKMGFTKSEKSKTTGSFLWQHLGYGVKIYDAVPSNVLKDKFGKLHFVDVDVIPFTNVEDVERAVYAARGESLSDSEKRFSFPSMSGNVDTRATVATPEEVARFRELTKGLGGKLTQADLVDWKAKNPEAYAELEELRAAVLKRLWPRNRLVDSKGNLIPLYHGTAEGNVFYSFRPSSMGLLGAGVYLSADYNYAAQAGPRVMRVFANISSDRDGEFGNPAGGAQMAEVVIRKPHNVKSADPLALDEKGNLITPDQWADIESPDIRLSVAGTIDEVRDRKLQDVLNKAVPEAARQDFLKPNAFDDATKMLMRILQSPRHRRLKARGKDQGGERFINMDSPDDATAKKWARITGARWDGAKKQLEARAIHALTEDDRVTHSENKIVAVPMIEQTVRQADFVTERDFVLPGSGGAKIRMVTFAKLYTDPNSPTGVRWHFVEARKNGMLFETQYSDTDPQAGSSKRARESVVVGMGDTYVPPKKKKDGGPGSPGFAQGNANGASPVGGQEKEPAQPAAGAALDANLDNTVPQNVQQKEEEILEEISNLEAKRDRMLATKDYVNAGKVSAQIAELEKLWDEMSSVRESPATLSGSQENIPGSNSGLLAKLPDAPYAEKLEYHQKINAALIDPDTGRDTVAEILGMATDPRILATGPSIYAHDGIVEVNPADIMVDFPSVDDAVRYMILRGAFTSQNAIAGIDPKMGGAKDAALFDIGRVPTEPEIRSLRELFTNKDDTAIYLNDRGFSIVRLALGFTGTHDDAMWNAAVNAAQELFNAQATPFKTNAFYHENEYGRTTNTENDADSFYFQTKALQTGVNARVSARPLDIQTRAADRLRTRLAAVNKEFADRGYGNPEPVNGSQLLADIGLAQQAGLIAPEEINNGGSRYSPAQGNEEKPIVEGPTLTETPLSKALDYQASLKPTEGKSYSRIPKVYTEEDRVYSDALRQARQTMPEKVRRAMEERVYFADDRLEDSEAASAFLDALVGSGISVEEAAYRADTNRYGSRLTPRQRVLVKAIAARRLQNGWDALNQLVAEGRATPGQILLKEHYLAESEALLRDVAENMTSSAQMLNLGNTLARLFNPRALVPIGYKFPIIRKQHAVLSKDPVVKTIIKAVNDAKAEAGSSTKKKLADRISKAGASGAAPDDKADVERLLKAMLNTDLPVTEQIKAAVIASEMRRARRQLEKHLSGVSDSGILNPIYNKVRAMVAGRMERALADMGPLNQARPEDREILKQRFRDMWDSSILAKDAFDRVKEALSLENDIAAAALNGVEFDITQDTGARHLVRQLVDFNTEVFASMGQRDMTRTGLAALIKEGFQNVLQPEIADIMGDAIISVYDAELQEVTNRKISALVRGNRVREVVDKPLADRLLKASNLGALTQEHIYNILAPKFNLPSWDEATAQRIDAALQDVQRLPENSLPRDEAIAKIMSEIAKAHRESAKGLEKASHIAETLSTFWTAGVLSGPPTHIVNAVATNMSVFLESMAQATGYFFAAKRAGISTDEAKKFFGDFGRGIGTILQRGAAFDNKIGLEFRAALQHGVSRFKSEKGETLSVTEQWVWKKNPENLKDAWNNVLSLYKYVGRAMLAADAANSVIANDTALLMRARFEAMQKGVTGADLDSYVDRIMDKSGEVRARAVKQAQEEMQRGDFSVELPFGDRGKPMSPKLMMARRVEQIIERELFDKDDIDASRRFTEYATYNSDAYGLIGMMADIMSQITSKIGVTKPLMPFPRTISNIVNQMLNFSPYGFARAHNFSLSGVLASRYHHESQKGVEFLKYAHPSIDKASPEYYAALGRASVGTAGLVALLALAMKGLDDEKESGEQGWFEITASGPADFGQRKQLQDSGVWSPNTIRIGDLRLRYTDWPALGIVLAAVGAYSDARRYNKIDEKSAGEQLLLATMGISSAVMEKQMLSGLSDLFKVIGGGPEGVSSAKRLSSSYLGGFTNPQMLRWVRATFDSTPPEQSTISGWLMSMAPMAIGYNKPSLNVLGQPIERSFYEPTTQRFVNIKELTNPHPVLSPLVQAGVYVPVPRRTQITDPLTMKDRSMTSDEYYDYAKVYGETVGRMLTPEMAKTLAEMPADIAQKWLDDNVRPAARDAAKTAIMRQWLAENQ